MLTRAQVWRVAGLVLATSRGGALLRFEKGSLLPSLGPEAGGKGAQSLQRNAPSGPEAAPTSRAARVGACCIRAASCLRRTTQAGLVKLGSKLRPRPFNPAQAREAFKIALAVMFASLFTTLPMFENDEYSFWAVVRITILRVLE